MIENTIDVVIFSTVERKGQGIWRNVRYKKRIWIDNMNRSKSGRDFFLNNFDIYLNYEHKQSSRNYQSVGKMCTISTT